ncbi:hypothetical protein B0H11DRAFT_2281753 [Mycena galericulata]|nr:hypothetical protein B0H11DRAFT_2281753 [Mycena galericulata]
MSISLKVKFERPESWLSQANYVFALLNVRCNKENYALIKTATFTLAVGTVVGPFYSVPHGYLFVSYWSFDPTGAERLSTEAARHHGFPALRFCTRVKLYSWDDSDYAGLREFHDSRGFDPDSQDMLRDLGYIIYKLPHGESSTAGDEDSCDSPILALRTLFADTPLRENTVENFPSVHLATPCGPEDFIPLSRTSKFVMAVKFALILFIAVSSAYNGVRSQLD